MAKTSAKTSAKNFFAFLFKNIIPNLIILQKEYNTGFCWCQCTKNSFFIAKFNVFIKKNKNKKKVDPCKAARVPFIYIIIKIKQPK